MLEETIANLEDGDTPVTQETKDTALRLAKLLPGNPDITADNDGEINFEYYYGKYLIFSFSIDALGGISYAGCAGEGDTGWYGLTKFENEVPLEILEGIERAKGVSHG